MIFHLYARVSMLSQFHTLTNSPVTSSELLDLSRKPVVDLEDKRLLRLLDAQLKTRLSLSLLEDQINWSLRRQKDLSMMLYVLLEPLLRQEHLFQVEQLLKWKFLRSSKLTQERFSVLTHTVLDNSVNL